MNYKPSTTLEAKAKSRGPGLAGSTPLFGFPKVGLPGGIFHRDVLLLTRGKQSAVRWQSNPCPIVELCLNVPEYPRPLNAFWCDAWWQSLSSMTEILCRCLNQNNESFWNTCQALARSYVVFKGFVRGSKAIGENANVMLSKFTNQLQGGYSASPFLPLPSDLEC